LPIIRRIEASTPGIRGGRVGQLLGEVAVERVWQLVGANGVGLAEHVTGNRQRCRVGAVEEVATVGTRKRPDAVPVGVDRVDLGDQRRRRLIELIEIARKDVVSAGE
jgi:hypothetical protein